MKLNEYVKVLEGKIQSSYEEGVTMENAEKLAAEFLRAMMLVSAELRTMDLDVSMRKTGVKAIRAAVYMEAATKDPKKPSDVLLQAGVDMNDMVQKEQDAHDTLLADKNELERLFDIFQNAHVYYRGVAKNNFGT